ncbi:SAP domain-containing protein [Ceratocystis lukuohia]|uniref:SAP domain-containing protein n=1 Tax=Ceratocystis lukuohia TaxID=2019550 RepID=A0ABR4MHY4_9PEZI
MASIATTDMQTLNMAIDTNDASHVMSDIARNIQLQTPESASIPTDANGSGALAREDSDYDMHEHPKTVAPAKGALSPKRRRRSSSVEGEDKQPLKRLKDAQGNASDTSPSPRQTGSNLSPPLHDPTCALYVKNLSRSMSRDALRDHISSLVEGLKDGPLVDITEFYIDHSCTHAFIVFTHDFAADAVREALHGAIWPDKSQRRPLWVDFVAPERVPEWISMEETANRRNIKWEVQYTRDSTGTMGTQLVTMCDSAPANAPLGPKGQHSGNEPTINAPRGPRANYEDLDSQGIQLLNRGDGRNIVWTPLTGHAIATVTSNPPITYQMVSTSYVEDRVRNMRSYYFRNPKNGENDRALHDSQDDIYRFSFAHSTVFINRGKENFAGIRHPRKEQRLRNSDQRKGQRQDQRHNGPSRPGNTQAQTDVPKNRQTNETSSMPLRKRQRNRRERRNGRERQFQTPAQPRSEAAAGPNTFGTQSNGPPNGPPNGAPNGARRRRRNRKFHGVADSYKPSYDQQESKDVNDRPPYDRGNDMNDD